jgi:hypothetical protein
LWERWGQRRPKRKNLHEGALGKRMAEHIEESRTVEVRVGVRTVYDYPVAGHLCSDGAVRYIKLVRRGGNQPQGTCTQCQTSFQYVKPKPSPVRHVENLDDGGVTHF